MQDPFGGLFLCLNINLSCAGHGCAVAGWLLRWRWLLVDGCENVYALGIAMAVKFDYGFNDKFICLFLHFYYIYYYLRNTIDFCLVQFLLCVGAFYHVTL